MQRRNVRQNTKNLKILRQDSKHGFSFSSDSSASQPKCMHSYLVGIAIHTCLLSNKKIETISENSKVLDLELKLSEEKNKKESKLVIYRNTDPIKMYNPTANTDKPKNDIDSITNSIYKFKN